MTKKKPRQKFKYLENNKTFYYEIKSIFNHFYRLLFETRRMISCLVQKYFFVDLLGSQYLFKILQTLLLKIVKIL